MTLPARALLTVALLPFANIAIAQCPTAADMANGVRVTFDNGDTTELRNLGGTVIEVTERYTWATQALRYQADYGIYSREQIEISPGGADIPESAMRFDYPAAPPAPAADAAPFQTVRMVHEFGMGAEAETWQIGFRAMEAVVIGTCTYDALAAGIRLRAGEADQKDQFFYYLPELGAGFIVTWVDEDGRHDTVPVQIQALR